MFLNEPKFKVVEPYGKILIPFKYTKVNEFWFDEYWDKDNITGVKFG